MSIENTSEQSNTIAELLTQAFAAYENEQYDDAKVLYENALAIDAENLDALLGLAKTFYKQKELDSSEKLIQKVLFKFPAASAFMALQAEIEIDKGKYETCIALCTKILKLDPDSFVAYSFLGMANAQLQIFTKAEKFYLKALEISPHHYIPGLNLSSLYLKKLNEPQKALDILLQLFGNVPGKETETFYTLLAHSYYRNGELLLALGYTMKLAELFPENVSYHYLAGSINSELSSPDGIPYWQKVIELTPDRVEAWTQLLSWCLADNQIDLGFPYALEAVKLFPDNAIFTSYLGRYYLEQAQYEKARECFELTLSLTQELQAYYNILLGKACDKLGDREVAKKSFSEVYRYDYGFIQRTMPELFNEFQELSRKYN